MQVPAGTAPNDLSDRARVQLSMYAQTCNLIFRTLQYCTPYLSCGLGSYPSNPSTRSSTGLLRCLLWLAAGCWLLAAWLAAGSLPGWLLDGLAGWLAGWLGAQCLVPGCHDLHHVLVATHFNFLAGILVTTTAPVGYLRALVVPLRRS